MQDSVLADSLYHISHRLDSYHLLFFILNREALPILTPLPQSIDFSAIPFHNLIVCTAKKLLFLFLALALFSFPLIIPSNAQKVPEIPVEYGEIIYQFNEKSPNQIFVIGISHRDALTCLNGDNTSRVQAEIYKIGDWLIHNQGLELLLPEGFFKSLSTRVEKKNIKASGRVGSCASLDMDALEKRLSDNDVYVNAEMLLKETHPLRLAQIEDKELYDAVRINIVKLVGNHGSASDYSLMSTKLGYLQEKRTAAMLQKIPEIVDAEFRQGNIKSKRAIFTVGMYHLHEIIRYLNQNRIIIHAPLSVSNPIKDDNSELNLSKENFGVSVIIPRTLASDQKTLEINELDKIVRECQSNPLTPP